MVVTNDGGEDSWVSYTKDLLISLNLEEEWKNQETGKSTSKWNTLIEERIQEREQTEWYQRAVRKPKLRTYIKYKSVLKQEEYLENEDEVGRKMLARIRSGTNNLRIETGRYERPRIPEEHRICKLCKDGVENEEHFLFECQTYKNIRKDFLAEVNRNKLDDELKESLFGKGSTERINKTIRFIRRAVAKRNRILEMIH